MYNFRMYIPFGRDIDLLNAAITSIVPQMKEFSSFPGKKIVVINNSGSPIEDQVVFPDEVDVWSMPFELVHAQEANWMLKSAISANEPFCMTTHTDSELLPGAIETMLKKYEEVKDSKWSVIMSKGWATVFCIYNLNFFLTEDIWFDPFLFPFYFMDNHMGRLMTLRGWTGHDADSEGPLIKHKSSHYLKDDRVFCRKNECAFPAHGLIYSNIWGGLPGAEKSSDIYANGTLPRKAE